MTDQCGKDGPTDSWGNWTTHEKTEVGSDLIPSVKQISNGLKSQQ